MYWLPFYLTLLVYHCAYAAKVIAGGIEYIGVSNKTSGINTFWGIRYAQAPTGDLRWRPPVGVPHAQSTLVINATELGPACPQSAAGWEDDDEFTVSQSEDCLLLNIQTPMWPHSQKLPIMVGIHGGGYIGGSSRNAAGDSLVHQANGSMIFVSIQYRLGPLGFLAGDDVKADGTHNAGLLDQRLAFEWIRDNIHHFGGDSSKITIAGGSAGGSSVTLQMVMNGGSDDAPFHAAIAEYAWWTPIYGKAWLNKQYTGFLHATNCSTLRCLRELPISTIQRATRSSSLQAYNSKQYAYGTYYWGPSIDGSIIRRHPWKEFRDGHFTKIPMLVDRNFYEGFIFSNYSLSSEDDALSDFSALWHEKDGDYKKIAWSLYPESSYNTSFLDQVPAEKYMKEAGFIKKDLTNTFIRRSALFGDAIINCPSTYIAEGIARAGMPTYKMVFNSGFQFHSASYNFLFSTNIDVDGSRSLGTTSIPGNATLATLIRNYFISFTLHHDPNTIVKIQQNTPLWSAYDTETRKTMYLSNEGVRIAHDPDYSEQCRFLQMGRGNNAGIWPQW